jgi:ribulose-phosphate 3-epimerase
LRAEPRLTAALFNADHARLAEEVERVADAGVDALHLDVFDGRLLPDLGFPPRTIASLRPLTQLPFEVHLAAERPERFAAELAAAGADLVLFHAEGAPMLFETVFEFRERGLRVGVALGLGAPLSIAEAALPFVDAVLLLARVTGEGARGAVHDERVLPRVAALRDRIDAAGAAVELQVAGGVNRSNLGPLIEAGADAAGLGGALYRAHDMATEVAALRGVAAGAAA